VDIPRTKIIDLLDRHHIAYRLLPHSELVFTVEAAARQRGVVKAVAPVGLPENIPVIFDAAIARCPKVSISSGDPLAGLELDPQDLIRVVGARLASIASPE
jgi:hypothetical protein